MLTITVMSRAAVLALLLCALSVTADAVAKTMSLKMAAVKNDAETAALLIEKGADVNAKEDKDKTPLYWAALNNSREVAVLLIATGADVDATSMFAMFNDVTKAMNDVHGVTPLHAAARNGNREIIELLIEWDADVNAKASNGMTALHFAARDNYHEAASLLIKHGANVNAKDNNGATPLNWTEIEDVLGKTYPETAAVLRKHGAISSPKNDVVKNAKDAAERNAPKPRIPVESGSTIVERVKNKPSLIDELVDMVKQAGFRCDSLSTVIPFLLSRGYTIKCNHRAYHYEIEDKGGRWFVSVQ